MARSFAVWINKLHNDKNSETLHKSSEQKTTTIDEVHINYWCTTKPRINCIDIGIKLTCNKIQNKKTLNIYIPFKLSNKQIIDLSDLIVNNDNLSSAIFNDHVIKKEKLNNKHVILKFLTSENEALIFNTKMTFSENKDDNKYDKRVNLTHNNDDYTIIKFCLSECTINTQNNNKKYYLRFRLNLTDKDTEKFIHTIKNKGQWLKPISEQLDIIDFRINELRILPKDILSGISEAYVCPQKYHLFIIRDEADEYQLSHSGNNYKKCRILENETWQEYFDDISFINNHSPMIYHWTKAYDKKNNDSSSLTDFIAVAKFKKTKASWKTIVGYILIVLILGVFSSSLYEVFGISNLINKILN